MKKGRFNWVDGLIAAVVLLMLAGAVYKFRGGNRVTATNVGLEPVCYKVVFEGLRAGSRDALQAGDVMYDKDSGNPIGTIVDISAGDSCQAIFPDDGTVVMAPQDDRFDVEVTLEAQAAADGNSWRVNRVYQLNVGSQRGVYTKYFSSTGTITAIEPQA